MKTYTGHLKGFPQAVIDKMVERQVEQGNDADADVFDYAKDAHGEGGGFDWDKTTEGRSFWVDVIFYKKFNLFFSHYPKNKSIYPKVMWVSDDVDFDCKVRRVVFMERCGRYLAWATGETIKDAENVYTSNFWRYAKDIEPEDQIVELTLRDISEGKGVGVPVHLLRIKE